MEKYLTDFALTEEMLLNETFLEQNPGVRRFRIEYGFECSCPESTFYLPKDMPLESLEAFVKTIPWECECYSGGKN